ncbi:hypothetical protein NIE88_12690 [Sporolactobacillus shoreicorticis]|uniref:SH3b domain-containing protein n=1 Tax=Sporolactobacillus shoreicorticis TaxID=1923877 RepID=A0ABW5S9Y9_9BACL|nr:hypothetical protein [Sporolactobacillus shoreicorticis]MCO7126622.1 hypothetical protein [Sporolactobacillus shoreicorticis]
MKSRPTDINKLVSDKYHLNMQNMMKLIHQSTKMNYADLIESINNSKQLMNQAIQIGNIQNSLNGMFKDTINIMDLIKNNESLRSMSMLQITSQIPLMTSGSQFSDLIETIGKFRSMMGSLDLQKWRSQFNNNSYNQPEVSKEIEELQETFDDAITKNNISSIHDINITINNYYKQGMEQIGHVKDPTHKQILVQFLIKHIFEIIMMLFEIFNLCLANNPPQVINNYNYQNRIIIKNERKVLKNTNMPSYIKNYRVNIKDELPVFLRMRTTSTQIDKLYIGKIVEIIDKHKNWSFVRYRGNSDLKYGWVFTRYIKTLGK